jgi:hypothetical protein
MRVYFLRDANREMHRDALADGKEGVSLSRTRSFSVFLSWSVWLSIDIDGHNRARSPIQEHIFGLIKNGLDPTLFFTCVNVN